MKIGPTGGGEPEGGLLPGTTSIEKVLCTGGVSFAPFILLLISNLFCTKGKGGEGGMEHSPPFPPTPCRDEVNLLCPGGGGRVWLASLSPCGGGGEGRKGEGEDHWKEWGLKIT